MAYTFVFIGEDGPWPRTLEHTLSSMGRLSIVQDDAIEKTFAQSSYNLAIIYAAGVPDLPRLIKRLHSLCPGMPVAVASHSPTWRRALEAIRSGASSYLSIAMSDKEIREEIRKALESLPPMNQGLEQATNVTKHDQKQEVPPTILLADNNGDFLEVRGDLLKLRGYKVIRASSPAEARDVLQKGGIDLAVLDIRLTDDYEAGDTSGLDLARVVAPTTPKIVLTNFPTWQSVVKAYRFQPGESRPNIGFVSKADGPDALMKAIDNAIPRKGRRIKTGLGIRNFQKAEWLKAASRVFTFIFLKLPATAGRVVLDVFGRDSATEITAAVVGYVLIIVIVLVLDGLITPLELRNTFEDVWRFFFPLK